MKDVSTGTLYLAVDDVVEIVRRTGLAECFAQIAARIEADYCRWREFDKTSRVASHSAKGVIELMPISDGQTYTFKYVNGHPGNTSFGLPTVMAFGVLADVTTGAPLLLSELTLTTAMRTAAMSALAARLLARTNSRCMALIGNGAQSEFQALAFHNLCGIEKVRLFDSDPDATSKLVMNLRKTSNLAIEVCDSIAEAVSGADIVTTITADKTNAAILLPDMIEPGQHINAVGGDCPGKTELHPGILCEGRVFVEYEPQSRIEGELQQMPSDFAATEIFGVIAGQQPGRVSEEDVTIFDSVGFALEDFSALHFLYESAKTLSLGKPVQLVPACEDPKNLFSVFASLSSGPSTASQKHAEASA
ncbi:ornithine cyclodeaminase [Paracoccus benzoatiresistens]|uniref:Ornithine cyclodeaminase n=1 Tax=Paracoccus benzoatiresistens TaxID=2997341 RepID=A0ABT4JA17_9RHOB|nr:ornithine cyclodeaminase [Paracoccus sp. EF6]MCZ0963917.1 ornithine cyclodeaminase [Paracoccus sp. EF6]